MLCFLLLQMYLFYSFPLVLPVTVITHLRDNATPACDQCHGHHGHLPLR
jgi:hypothetical protein